MTFAAWIAGTVAGICVGWLCVGASNWLRRRMHIRTSRRAISRSHSERLHLAEKGIYLLSQEIDHTWELMLALAREGRGLSDIPVDRLKLARRVAYLPVCAESYRIPLSCLDNLLSNPEWMPPKDYECAPSGIERLRENLVDIRRRVDEAADPVILEAWNKQNLESVLSIPRLVLSCRASAIESLDVHRVIVSGDDPGGPVAPPN